jgi:hypothetical protein
MPLKAKTKRQRGTDLVGFYLRVPAELKGRIDARATELNVSQANICVSLIDRGLAGEVSTLSTLSTEVTAPFEIAAWLDRIK